MASRANRKFKDFSEFKAPFQGNYFLLPFRFHRVSEFREVLVNEVGDYLIVPCGTAEKVIRRKLDPAQHQELYADLIANFFNSEERTPPLLDVLATRYRTKKSFLDGFTSLHIFVMTLRCEHTCHYCQVSRVSQNKNAYDMQQPHIDKGIEMMMSSPNTFVTMEFQGGEALLAFDAIVYAIEKAKDLAKIEDKKVTYVICTNLAPLTDEMLFYCRANEVLLSTSLDGPSFIHNKNRTRLNGNSYEMATSKICRAKELLGKDKVSALLTTTALTLDHPKEIVDEYFFQGFRNIFLRPISPYGFALYNAKKNQYETARFLEFYKKALGCIIEYNRKGDFYREDYATILLRKMLTPFPVGYVDLQSPAGLINSVVVFNYDGKVYATDEARMLAEMGDFTFQIGDLSTDTYQEIFYGPKAQELSAVCTNESLPGCSECAFQGYCGADPVFHHATQGSMVGYLPESSFCQRNMELIRYLFELMDTDKEIEKIFNTWIA